jgi:hypothetical protein
MRDDPALFHSEHSTAQPLQNGIQVRVKAQFGDGKETGVNRREIKCGYSKWFNPDMR